MAAFGLLGPALLAPDPASAGGVTVITHGFNSGVTGWIIPMAEQIAGHPGFPGTTVSCYQIDVTKSGGVFSASATHLAGPTPDQTDSGEIVIKLSWETVDGLFQASTGEVATAAVDALMDGGLIPESGGRPLAELPLHLIGHSRGGSVVSEMARKFGQLGVWVDHVTTLDPVPVGWFGDADVTTWENVLFADNYWQTLDGSTTGDIVFGAYDRKLLDLSGGHSSAHSDVHLWYHGAVELTTPVTGTDADITASERANWWTAPELEGAAAGLYYSLIGGGDRLSSSEPGGDGTDPVIDGYNQRWDLGAGQADNRSSITSRSAQWPNVIVCRRTESGSVPAGTTFDLQLHYQSEASATEVTILLDPDRNPWNGNETTLLQEALTGSGSMDPLSANLDVPVTESHVGVAAVLARIEQGGRTRYLYLPESLEVTAPLPPPSIVPGSLRIESGMLTFTVAGTVGQTVTVKAGTNLTTWQPIATQTLLSPTWTFSDPDTASFTKRFYRLGEE